ncbi:MULTISPECIES: GntR family transcriptional regulator [Bifidobacterium]|uniref:GntR family transcriptional regulator n=1 Tax=Bifidobacterium myosotis TaxID=1630166 RepID=A0A261FKJ9_9BIFI|nr:MULTISPECIES: GntR family transcriptional regulator [Bifidobacterium]OZG59687.1 GntR family transcriptional regulator [Bifidobacterium myosotis]TPF94438.1 GntR family transcriptional regulator [Bifidobacterium sp. UTBIF-78]
MIIEVDQRSDVPIYEQLHLQIIAAIANDELVPGDQLPSVRSLAVDLGINLHTVNKAYALLRDEGYIVMRRGSGALVADWRDGSGEVNLVAEMQDKQMNDDLYRLALAYKARGGAAAGFLDAAERQCGRAYRKCNS